MIRRLQIRRNLPTTHSVSEPGACSAIAVTTAQIEPGLFQDQLVTVVSRHGGSSQGAWVIHQSLDAGASWSSIAEPFRSGYESQYPQGIAVDSIGNIYVAGYADERITTTTRKQNH